MERFRRDSKIPFQEIEGRAVLVVPARREAHELDEVATFLWARLKTEQTLDDLADAVCESFEVDRPSAVRDVRAFLELLEAKGLAART